VTRYLIICGDKFVAAAQPDTKRILLTDQRDDAGSWATYERTIKAARFVQETTGIAVFIQRVKEPEYPQSWTKSQKKSDVV
jgi:hypothetical protein